MKTTSRRMLSWTASCDAINDDVTHPRELQQQRSNRELLGEPPIGDRVVREVVDDHQRLVKQLERHILWRSFLQKFIKRGSLLHYTLNFPVISTDIFLAKCRSKQPGPENSTKPPPRLVLCGPGNMRVDPRRVVVRADSRLYELDARLSSIHVELAPRRSSATSPRRLPGPEQPQSPSAPSCAPFSLSASPTAAGSSCTLRSRFSPHRWTTSPLFA